MKILALEVSQPGASPDEFSIYLEPEAARVWELYECGVLREIYFRQDSHEAVLVLECEDAAGADRWLQSLPLVRAGLIRFDIIPLLPYTGLSRLFAAHPSGPSLSFS